MFLPLHITATKLAKMESKISFYDASAFEMDGRRYVIARQSEAQISTGSSEIALASVFDLSRQQTGGTVSAEWIRTAIDGYKKDDVFHKDFVQTVVFAGAKVRV